MAGKLSKAIWLGKFELSSLSHLSLTGKTICRSKCLVNTDIWFNLIRGGSSCGMQRGKGEWESREFSHSRPAVLVALGHQGKDGHQKKCWLCGQREPRPGLGSSTHPGTGRAELRLRFGAVLGSARDLLGRGKIQNPRLNDCCEGWGWPSASWLHPGSPSAGTEQISLC